jgi:hypothetical protein
VVAAAALGAVPGAALRAAESACDLGGVARVVAVGDVHGTHDGFLEVLRLAGLLDAKGRWRGGRAHLVQTGDILDRGPDSRKVMDLLMRLEGEARKAGGRVHALLGNHEAMNILGDLRYVSPGEYEAFRTPRSERLREERYQAVRDARAEAARAAGQPFDEGAFRAAFLKEIPLGFLEHRQAFSEEGRYGKWLRQRDTMVKIDGVAFVHGGLVPEVARLGCEAINATVRGELGAGLDRTLADPASALSTREEGPLWYRGLAREDEAAHAAVVDEVLSALGARTLVIGHTLTETGRLKTRFAGRVVMIDTGMLPAYGGHRSALEIGPQGMAALYPGGRETLLPKAAGCPPCALDRSVRQSLRASAVDEAARMARLRGMWLAPSAVVTNAKARQGWQTASP